MSVRRQVQGVIARDPCSQVVVEEVTLPPLESNEVLIRVTACGLCHSDVHFMRGTSARNFPYLLGHEATGIVEQVGSQCSSVRIGEAVVVAPVSACGTCKKCRAGRRAACPTRLLTDKAHVRLQDGSTGERVLGVGGLAEYVLVPERNVVPVDEHVPPVVAALFGCSLPTGYGAAVHTAQTVPGDDVVVVGCGGVGVAAIAGARSAGAERVVAVDNNPRRLPTARRFGATSVVDASERDVVTAVSAILGSKGPDVVIDAVGGARSFAQCMRLHGLGTRWVIVGAPSATDVATFALREFFIAGGQLAVSIWGDCDARVDIPQLASSYQRGELPLDDLVTRVPGLAEVGAAFEALLAGELVRPVVDLSEG